MKRRVVFWCLVSAFWALPVLALGVNPAAALASAVVSRANRLPLPFEANLGQTDPEVLFMARAPGLGLYLTKRKPSCRWRRYGNGSAGRVQPEAGQ